MAVGVAVASPASADVPADPSGGVVPAGERVALPDGATSVTLVTGDQVTYSPTGGTVAVRPGPDRDGVRFVVQRSAGHVHVVPADTLGLLAADRLDPRLFDVTALVGYGYDDRTRGDLPLLVGGGTSTLAGLPGAGATATRRLPHVGLTALRLTKADAAGFWRRAAGADPAGGGGGSLAGGLTRIWLDGRRDLELDHSVPQIGAPDAWRAGYTGAGVTVAVLDTGIDATHPDLAGRIVAARNFTGGEPVDDVGHGTHVASTIAGSGAASSGRYRGVAPDARLVDGKVCDQSRCQDSAILAGMEWAAAEQHARVVNMSLGEPDTPGVDPVEEAVNRLTAEYGTLFVVSAGNGGRLGAGTVASPSTADAALSVGAVDGEDRLADFSARGPRPGDGALKPDITAPGVGIVAARSAAAKGVDPVDGSYARMSGTSMAAPHVTGVAAILAQQHPDWSAERLRSALMGSARPTVGVGVFDQGAGRVDAAAAVAQEITAAPASISLGVQRWPHHDDRPDRRVVTYRNDGPVPVTLGLAVAVTGPDGAPAPRGMFTVTPDRLTVPAGGQASAEVVSDTRVHGPDGTYSGRLVATGGAVPVGTPLAVVREVESYDVTVRHLDRDGAPATSYRTLLGSYHSRSLLDLSGVDGTATVRLPADDDYYLFTTIGDPADPGDVRMLSRARLRPVTDTVVTLDARAARPVHVTVPDASARIVGGEVVSQAVLDAEDPLDGAVTTGLGVLVPRGSAGFAGISLASAGPPADRTRFLSHVAARWAEPGADGSFTDSPSSYNTAWYEYGRSLDGLDRDVRPEDLATVRSRFAAPAGGQVGYHKVWVQPAGVSWLNQWGALDLFFRVPGARVDYYTTGDVRWRVDVDQLAPTGWPGIYDWKGSQSSPWTAYRPGRGYAERWNYGVRGPAFPAPWDPLLPYYLRRSWWVRNGEMIHTVVPAFTDGTSGHVGGAPTYPGTGPGDPDADRGSLRLYRDGRFVDECRMSGYWYGLASCTFPGVSPGPAVFRAEMDITQRASDVSPRVTATWTLHSDVAADDADFTALPVMAVRFGPELDDRNIAPAGQRFDIPVWVEAPAAQDRPVDRLTVEVSYDDGQTWQPVALQRRAHGWNAVVEHPDRSGYVSLRATAVDGDGNSVDQTIYRAYRIETSG